MMCYVDHNAIGEEHGKSCGAKCIKNGGPVGIVENGKAYLSAASKRRRKNKLPNIAAKRLRLKAKRAIAAGMRISETPSTVRNNHDDNLKAINSRNERRPS